MTEPTTATATIAPIYFTPGEALGEFVERFAAATQGKPAELVAVVVWRLGQRAYLDGIDEGLAMRQNDA